MNGLIKSSTTGEVAAIGMFAVAFAGIVAAIYVMVSVNGFLV